MCEHTWGKIGIFNGDGTFSIPCINCDDELRIATVDYSSVIIKEGFAPVFSSGVKLKLVMDDDGISKIVCREIEKDYQLDDLDLKPGDVVIDIGAHKGIVSCYLAKRYPGIKIVAVEPFENNFYSMLENVVNNHLEDNIELTNQAITKDGREIHLAVENGNSGGINIYGDAGKITRSSTIQHICRWQDIEHIALLKIDCEGAEFEILESAGNFLDRIDHIRGEFHLSGPADELLEMVKKHVPDTKVTIQGQRV